MKLALLFLLTLSVHSGHAQIKTQTSFMVGNYSSKEWEKLDFSKSEKGDIIIYSYAGRPEGKELSITGTKYIGKTKVLMVRIPGITKLYYINPDKKNNRIQFASVDRKYSSWFQWAYEGPVNGVGTFCSQCAQDTNEAFNIIKTFID